MRETTPLYLPAIVAAREQARRRALLLGIAALLLLSTSPVFGHHLALGTSAAVEGVDHFGQLCLVALHLLLAPVHDVFHALVVAGAAYAVWDRARAWWRVRRTLGMLAVANPAVGGAFWTAARHAGVDPERVCVVPGLPNPAFTVGLMRPRIYVAESLASWLSPAQLAVVLAHEGAHVQRRDPLRLSALRFVGCLLFWIPALRRLAADVADEAEIQADDHAAGQVPLVLASAILAVAEHASASARPAALIGTTGFTGDDILERRVRRLVGEAPHVRTHVTRRSLLGAAAALALVWASGGVMAHPLPEHGPGDARSAEHCLIHQGSAWRHLICPSFGPWHGECPHDVQLSAR